MTINTFAGMGAHQSSQSETDSWLTPPAIIEALGGAASFDLDPCADVGMALRTAKECFTVHDNGLLKTWAGRVFMNPPYSNPLLARFMARMAEHNHGTALIFARTETDAFHRYVWERAAGLLFLRGRLCFHRPNGAVAVDANGNAKNAGAPSVLIAYGQEDLEILSAAPIEGAFVPLQMPRNFVVKALNLSWRQELEDFFSRLDGPITLAELYRAFADHPKSRKNQHWRPKLRQTLQKGKFERVEKGLWQRLAV